MASDNSHNNSARLRSRILDLEEELAHLKLEFADAERQDGLGRRNEDTDKNNSSSGSTNNLPLSLEEYKRYGRQMIMPEIGLQGTTPLT
jgi:adenylyltransferase/sulfurtransferase